MGELYNRMQGDLKLKNYAPGTQKAYLQCATRYAQFHVGRSPSVLGEREVRDFLLDLALKQATPAVMKMNLASLRFLYSTTLRRPEVVVGIPWPKVPRTLPDILSGTPVFAGTRVPVQALIDYLEGGETIDDFLAGFPTVRREQVVAFLEEATARMIAKAS